MICYCAPPLFWLINLKYIFSQGAYYITNQEAKLRDMPVVDIYLVTYISMILHKVSTLVSISIEDIGEHVYMDKTLRLSF